jgi:3-hydroxypropanoate dehydrogenase
MSGFNNAMVDEIFFNGTNIKSNFLCCIGYGDPSKIFMRLPRLDFEEVCEII